MNASALNELASWAVNKQPTNPAYPARTKFDIEYFLSAHLKVKRGPMPYGNGRKWELEVCPFNENHNNGCAAVFEYADGFGFKCQHNSCADKEWRDVRELFEGPRLAYPTGEAASRVNPLRHEPPVASTNIQAIDEWPNPEQLKSELPSVERFSEQLLPDSFRPLVQDVTERMQVPMDYPAVITMLCLAGSVNRRALIQPKAEDDGWLVVPNLWGGIIGPPGYMKSPVIQLTTSPLHQIQAEWRVAHDQAIQDFTRDREEYELRHTAWKDQFKVSLKKGHAAPGKPEDKPVEPKLQRLIANDATFEVLHQIMNHNPAGVLVIRDELTGWWSQLGRIGREGERAFFLQAWNGDTGFTIDRIGRGTIHVEACCVSMLGAIQPARLRSYMIDALEDGPSNDGLIQRFQLLVWPDTRPAWNYVDRKRDAVAEQQAAQVFRKLLQLDLSEPCRLRFTNDAQDLFIEWLSELEVKIRGSDLHPALTSHLSKYRKLMPALALLFELADWAAGIVDRTDAVSLHHAQQAVGFCKYLGSHARRVYSCITTPEKRAALELAEKIRRRKIGADGFFTTREVYRAEWTGLDSPEAVTRAVVTLQDAGWIREVSGGSGRVGGRPANRYEVNPRLWA